MNPSRTIAHLIHRPGSAVTRTVLHFISGARAAVSWRPSPALWVSSGQVLAACLVLSFAPAALAQDEDVQLDMAEEGAPAGDQGAESVPQASQPVRPASQEDLNSYLPSSSQPRIDGGQDTFDLNRRSEGGSVILGGTGDGINYGIDSDGSLDGQGIRTVGKKKPVPEFHMVKKGDTLWDISEKYYESPWDWPRVWSMNPQVENPHWIYPGDQLRTAAGSGQRPFGPTEDNSAGDGGFVGRERMVPPGTVFLRDQGYLGDPDRDLWGELVGAKEEQMMLSKGNTVYLLMRDGVDVRLGQRLTVFHEIRAPRNVEGARKPPGELVKIYGTVRVDAWDRETRIARGQLIESLDVVERGAKVGPVGRRFDVVEPTTATVDLEARVLTSIYPHIYYGQNQVVFIDRGSADGLEPGNRLRAVRHGDTWRRELKTGSKHSRMRVELDSPEEAPVEMTPLKGDDDTFPDEVVGEVMVLKTEEYSAVGLVTEASRALVAGDKLVAVQGY